MRLHRDRFPGDPRLDTAVSHAMLRRVAAGRAEESLRLYRPDDAMLFSSLDARRPGYARAVGIARELGFEPVTRLAGGHAAAFLDASMAFAWATPDADARQGIRARFERLSGWIAEALRRLGLDARVGAVPGEYCPGEFSVNLEGRVKVMGVGQRVIRGGAHVGGVLTVGRTDALRAALVPVYDALEIEFRPETAGGVADFAPGLEPEDVIGALVGVLRSEGLAVEPAAFDDAITAEAESLLAHHAPITSRVGPTALAGGKALLLHDDS
ncbi:MAG: lipoate--protein ligase family protein [Spirochaetaceae bacterium]|nr:lipoate--protein ligase family protein [Myxococcales bacterium]MCB9723965.1 lipoate--protein ligase family protein [Spirochaetaceae bacterium]